MRVGEMVKHRSAIAFAYKLALEDGGRAYDLLTILDQLAEHADKALRLQNKLLAEAGVTDGEMGPDHPAYSNVLIKMNEAYEVDRAIKITPLIEEAELRAAAGLSPAIIAGIKALGLLKPTSIPAPAPAAAAPKGKGKGK